MIDATFWFMLAIVAVLAVLAFQRGGVELVREGLSGGAGMLLRFGLLICVSFLAAGLAERLVPHEWVGHALGDASGLRGLVLATAGGALTPSGPFVAMPIAAGMLKSGAGTAAVATYVTSWSLLAVHRLVAWEVPILGWKFALMRYAICLALPIVAGLLVRSLGFSALTQSR